MVNEFWAAITQVALWGWIIATFIFIWNAFAGGVFHSKAWPWGVAVTCFFSLWTFAMLRI